MDSDDHVRQKRLQYLLGPKDSAPAPAHVEATHASGNRPGALQAVPAAIASTEAIPAAIVAPIEATPAVTRAASMEATPANQAAALIILSGPEVQTILNSILNVVSEVRANQATSSSSEALTASPSTSGAAHSCASTSRGSASEAPRSCAATFEAPRSSASAFGPSTSGACLSSAPSTSGAYGASGPSTSGAYSTSRPSTSRAYASPGDSMPGGFTSGPSTSRAYFTSGASTSRASLSGDSMSGQGILIDITNGTPPRSPVRGAIGGAQIISSDEDEDEDEPLPRSRLHNNWREQVFSSSSSKRGSTEDENQPPTKRGPGRPKGSRNLKTLKSLKSKAKKTANSDAGTSSDGMKVKCHICKDAKDGARLCTTECGHLFHVECLDRWITTSHQKYRTNKICPYCGSPYQKTFPFFG